MRSVLDRFAALIRRHRGRFGRFAVVGALNFGVDFASFLALFYVVGLPLIVANSVAVLLAATHSYVLNKLWTFRDPSRGLASLGRYGLFLLCQAVGLVLANLVIWALATLVPVPLAKLGSIAVTMLWNYWTAHRFVFRAA